MAEELGITHDDPRPARSRPPPTRRCRSRPAPLLPLVAVMLAGSSAGARVVVTFVVALLALAALGAAGARAGGAPFGKATVRMLVLGGLAMAVTALVGKVLGTAVDLTAAGPTVGATRTAC